MTESAPIAERVLYALWDSGLTVDHAAHNVRECRVAGWPRPEGQDRATRFALHRGGDADLFAGFTAAMVRDVLKRNAARLLP